MSQNQEQVKQGAGQSQGAAAAEAAGKTIWKPANGKAVGGVRIGGTIEEKAKAPSAPPPVYSASVEGLQQGMLPGVDYLLVAVPFSATQREDQENVTLATTHGSKRTRIPITLNAQGQDVTVFAIATCTFYAKAEDIKKSLQKG